MATIHDAVLDIKRLELLAHGDSPLHCLDARAKVLVTILFIILVVSFDRYQVAPLLPFSLFPAVMIARSGIPPLFVAKKTALLCPLILVIGIFNPLFDRTVLIEIGPWAISGGWISLASMLLRTLLTISAALILVGTTGFTAVCQALEKLGMPQVFAVQLLFLYRYLFVLTEEAARTTRARDLRSFGERGAGVAIFGSQIGHLLLRTWQRAERIHMAMLARGFAGAFHAHGMSAFMGRDILFIIGWSVLLLFLRMENGSYLIGSVVTGLIP